MKRILLLLLLLPLFSISQKKPLDHSVYDSWESIGERYISNDGKIVVYTINVQEGDSRLIIQETSGKILQTIPRGYNAAISYNTAFVVCKIKPTFKQTRDAKIAKKKPEDMPKDSLAIFHISTNKLEKIERVKSYKLPQENGNWLAYLLEKKLPQTNIKPNPDSATQIKELTRQTEKLQQQLDSLKTKLNNALTNGIATLLPQTENKAATPKKEDDIEEGTELVLRNLATRKEETIRLVQEYLFSKSGNAFVVETTKRNGNSKLQSIIQHTWLPSMHIDTLLKGFKDAKGFVFDEDGYELAFMASFDTSKNEQKNYSVYRAFNVFDAVTPFTIDEINTKKYTLQKDWRINENATLSFSKNGDRLFFGTSPLLPIKDTTLPEFERVNVDVWHYNDDDLMSVQLKQLDANTKRSYTAIYDIEQNKVLQLGNENLEVVLTTKEGDGKYFYAVSDSGKRVQQQWQGYTNKDVFVLNSFTGESKLIEKNVRVNIYPSYTGKYLLMYNEDKKQYSCYNAETGTTTVVAKDIPFPLYEEENDVPDAPNNYGVVKWMEEDLFVFIYDRYNMWMVDPNGKEKSVCFDYGRKDKIQSRYVTLDFEEKFFKWGQSMTFRLYNETSKSTSYINYQNALMLNKSGKPVPFYLFPNELSTTFSSIQKAKKANVYIFNKESYKSSQNIYSSVNADTAKVLDLKGNIVRYEIRGNSLTVINPQQSNYLWGTSELFTWKAYTGKLTEGILYKPENFDSTKKYPMIVYFYERNNQTLHNYRSPSPTASALNIPYFVSNGYVVFVPDIWYTTGNPGKNAYDYIVSGTRALIKKGFIDSTKIGLQGQSWGGYQTTYLITQTNLYKAAWAGAPVGNMFSAYGGIRWGSGFNRQMQYEHGQSRIGATPWQKPELYIKNSPLFHLPKVTTPLVIMHNDADDAVPWYQGIELFTAMRRLNKKVWMLNYNGEAHNLMERKNRKDIQQKQVEYFDWLLKDAPPAKWISEGVPAVMKGRVSK